MVDLILTVALAGAINQRYAEAMEFLNEEIRVLRELIVKSAGQHEERADSWVMIICVLRPSYPPLQATAPANEANE